MQYIGKLDRNKLGDYKDKIVTEDVVLTDERRIHILKDHEKDYEKIMQNIKNAVKTPNEILEDKKNTNTIFMINKLDKHNLNTIIKLNTTNDTKHPKNSIMTAWIIKDKNLARLRNG